MSRIFDYSILLQSLSGTRTTNLIGSFRLSQINTYSIQRQLKAAGINTNSGQYKAALREMTKNGNGAMYTNIQGIKNLMRNYNKDGDFVDPVTGLTGLLVTDQNKASKNRIISIPEASKEEMFELTKKEFLREDGILNGDTTKRSDVYIHMYRNVQKNDRLAAGHTLEQYERAYRQAFIRAAKAANPSWEPGVPIEEGALDSVTREDVEKNLKVSGSSLKYTALDTKA